jgi:replication-associated recombination protein RarA
VNTPGSRRSLPRTIGDHSPYDAVSALQKSIRRGKLDDALYWAADLDLSGMSGWLWRRLLIITSEDVGPAWPEGPTTIYSLFQMWSWTKSEVHIADAVIRLCRAPKTRLNDHASWVHWHCHPKLHRHVPDEALDMHTVRGKKMGRGLEHFLEVAAKVVPEVHDEDADRFELLERQWFEDRKPDDQEQLFRD